MQNKLYIVGTPIGNLGDISSRALKILHNADFIAAEDTRVTLKLLNKYNIKKPLISCREHNIKVSSEEIARRVLEGEACALVTDAGMPCISDPGAEVVDLCHKQGVETEVVPGPSALVAAVALSGFICTRFSFEGFLSTNARQKACRLEQIKNYDGLLIFYEAPHKLIKTLADLYRHLGDRKVAVCRELTKIHEEVLRGKLSEIFAHFELNTPRGEFVLVVEGYSEREDEGKKYTLDEAAVIAQRFVEEGMKTSEACKEAAKETGITKSLIYKELCREVKENYG